MKLNLVLNLVRNKVNKELQRQASSIRKVRVNTGLLLNGREYLMKGHRKGQTAFLNLISMSKTSFLEFQAPETSEKVKSHRDLP